MITRERLEELIEQGATIYSLDTKMYGCVKWLELENQLDKLEFKRYGEVKLFIIDNGWWHWFDLKDLYEDIEWMIEFGNITRTEELNLPTWEEFRNKKVKCVGFKGKATDCFFELYENTSNNRLILLDHDCDYEYFNKELTKENYTLACRKAKALFLCEEVE